MTAVRISGTFPKDERPDNGLEAIADQLADDAEGEGSGRWLVVGIIKAGRLVVEPGEPAIPSARFVALEVVTGEAADQARDLLNAGRCGRGRPALSGRPEATLFDPDDDDTEKDLGVNPVVCAACQRELHYDPAHEAHVDSDHMTVGGDGHTHTPQERP